MQSMQEKMKELAELCQNLNICNEQIEQLTKDRSRVNDSMIAKIIKLQRFIEEYNIFKQ